MDMELLQDMYYAYPELWYVLGGVFFLLVCLLLFFMFSLLKGKQKYYFLKRDRERYAETLYASRDGYFAFIYPDEKINDPRNAIIERCSRRLSVILNLEKGSKSDFNDVLKNFYKDDAKKICKYVGLLKEEGIAFEDVFALKSSDKYIRLEGVRINGSDGNIYCDMIWFRDVTKSTNRIKKLEEEKEKTLISINQKQELLDNLPFPIWLRNSNFEIVQHNKKFAEFLTGKNKENISENHLEIIGSNGESVSRDLAEKSHKTMKQTKGISSVAVKGKRLAMEAFETPFCFDGSLDKIFSAGCLIDVSELDEIKRNLREYQTAQLEILGGLGTAFAVFNQEMILQFYNESFASLWKLDKKQLQEKPSYPAFLDYARENRLLPEVPDYKAFRKDELKKFRNLIGPENDLIHMPEGKTLKRMLAPYPMGGVVFAFEDISDRIATTSAYNALLSVQNEILTNLLEGILIFGANGRLNFYNSEYVKLWNADIDFLMKEPDFGEILDSQKRFLTQDGDWSIIKQGLQTNILKMTSKTMVLQRIGAENLLLGVANLSDGSLLITYKKLSNSDD